MARALHRPNAGDRWRGSDALSMRFDGQAEYDAYDAYNVHPEHVASVTGVWIPNVAEFLELDDVLAAS